MNIDLLLNQYENHLKLVKICCGQYYDISNELKICTKCYNLVIDYSSSPYLYHYTILCNFLENYYIPKYEELNKLGLKIWIEFLIYDLLNKTNMYNKEFTITDFMNLPRNYLLKLIYVYLIKNGILNNSYL